MLQALFRGKLCIKITTQYRPHNNIKLLPWSRCIFFMLLQKLYLEFCYPAIRRTKEVTVYILCCFINIGDVIIILRFPSIYMVKSMVAHLVSFINNLPVDIGVLQNVFTNTKERCLSIKSFQLLQYKRSCFRMRSIIKCEV